LFTKGGFSLAKRNYFEGKIRTQWLAFDAVPDLKSPDGWSLSLITAVNRPRNHRLSPDSSQIAFIWDREDLSDVYIMPVAGGWPRRMSMLRPPVAFWDDEVPRWSPDGRWLAFTMERRVYVVPI
jgi:dipeptidyl aminopeptidase/acylaminoacyl peptidase